MNAEQQEVDLELAEQIFIGKITTILYLFAKRNPSAVQALRRETPA